MSNLMIKERDLKCLRLLNEYGAVKRKYLHMIYQLDDVNSKRCNQYKYARINKLKQEQYIEETDKIFILGTEGKKYLNLIGDELHYRNHLKMSKRKFLSEVHELLCKFNNFKITLGRTKIQLNQDGIEFIKLFYGKVISNDDKEYLVYKIKKESTNAYIKRVINEFNDFMATNIIIIFETERHLNYYKEIDGHKRTIKKEILVMYEEESFKVLNLISDNKLNNENVYRQLKNNIDIKHIKNYLYINNVITFNFLEDDFVNEELTDYFIKEKRIDNYYILCFEHQKDKIRNKFKNAKLVSLSINSMCK
ncbi:hypothetical protein [Clostridioides difficile]|uniref:hypothetical protein n=1 Tax=Clostridioides difficile TaxID=1496 RepID=UPI00040C5A25|nr:hypothetical protein [Clostridioides difficile]HBG7285426.1 hypothetical protein [Clostridioides difficile]